MIVKQNKEAEAVRLGKEFIKLQENNERSKRTKINWNRACAFVEISGEISSR